MLSTSCGWVMPRGPHEALSGDEHPADELTNGAFIISYDMATKTKLSVAMDQGLPVFRWTGEYLEFLDGCVYPGKFAYHPTATKKKAISGSSKIELALNAFQQVVDVNVRRDKKFAVEIRSIGYKYAALTAPNSAILQSLNCQGATHVGNMILVGAFELYESKELAGGVGVNGGPIRAGAYLKDSLASFDGAGDLSHCVREKADAGSVLPIECSDALHVSMVPLEPPTTLSYYFDDRLVGASSQEVAFIDTDLSVVSTALEKNLRQRAKEKELQINVLSAWSPTGVTCGVIASPTPSVYALQCKRNDVVLLERSGTRGLLAHLTPTIARELLEAVDPTARIASSPPAARVVFLIDLSLSMVVNDSRSFIADDIRRSKRYQYAAIYLQHFLRSGFNLQASIVTFGGPRCAKPIAVGGRELWSITEGSVHAGLSELQERLRHGSDCTFKHSTDIAEALRTARSILERNEHGEGSDIVILVTDGAHSVPASESTGTPEVEAAKLQAAGAKFMGIRVQLNNLSPLRNALAGADGPAIRARWAEYLGPEGPGLVEADWKDWLEEYAAENDLGTQLLDNLSGLEIADFALNVDDIDDSPLLTVHEQLVPQSGGHQILAKADCDDAIVGADDGNRHAQATCKIQIARDRIIKLRLEKPKCMEQLEFAKVFVSGSPPITLEVEHDTGTVVIFKAARAPGDSQISSPVDFVAEGSIVQGVSQCN